MKGDAVVSDNLLYISRCMYEWMNEWMNVLPEKHFVKKFWSKSNHTDILYKHLIWISFINILLLIVLFSGEYSVPKSYCIFNHCRHDRRTPVPRNIVLLSPWSSSKDRWCSVVVLSRSLNNWSLPLMNKINDITV